MKSIYSKLVIGFLLTSLLSFSICCFFTIRSYNRDSDQLALEELEHEFDICVIDTSPTLSLLTLNALVASDSIYIPLIAGFFELKGLGVLTNAIDAIRKSLRMFEIKGIFLTQEEKRQNFTK